MRQVVPIASLILSFVVFPVKPQQTPEEGPIIQANVDVVNVLCTVRDRKGNYVQNLRREDFEISEDGKRQVIDFFHNEIGKDAQPLTVALLVDTSGSVKDKLRFEQEAASNFLNQTLRKDKDMAAVVQFDSDINLVQDFTHDYSTLESAIFDMKAGGATKLYDAIWAAVEDLLRNEIGRKVMVILSDGADTQSMISEREAIRSAQDEDVIIYGIGIQNGRYNSDFGTLKRFSRATGGLFFNSKANPRKLREAFMKINREIKNQYSLGYVTMNTRQDGTFREVKVRVKKRRMKTTHRKGYFAPEGTS